jgi:membrane protein
VVAALAWMAMSLAFSFYVGRFGHYDKTYGSLGAVVGFMTWIWLSVMVVLLGAELNSEIQEQVGPAT